MSCSKNNQSNQLLSKKNLLKLEPELFLAKCHVQAATMTLMGKYTIRAESAEILARHLLLSRTGQTHSIEALGIEKSDINAMIRGENPSASMLLKMAEVLKMELSEVHNLIQQIKTDIASQN